MHSDSPRGTRRRACPYYSWLSAGHATSDVADTTRCSLARHTPNTKALQPLGPVSSPSHTGRQQIRSQPPVLCLFQPLTSVVLQPVVSPAS